MPEEDIHTSLQLLSAVGATLTASFWAVIGMRKADRKKMDEIQVELTDFKENVAKSYPSHKAMQACSDNINKHMDESLKLHTAELKLLIVKGNKED